MKTYYRGKNSIIKVNLIDFIYLRTSMKYVLMR
jgi:hypothetical protein